MLVALKREADADDLRASAFTKPKEKEMKDSLNIERDQKHYRGLEESRMTTLQMSLSQHMTADVNRSLNTQSNAIDQSLQNMTDSDLLLRCSFSKLLQDRHPMAPLSTADRKAEETKLFAALESVSEKTASQGERREFVDELNVELTRRV